MHFGLATRIVCITFAAVMAISLCVFSSTTAISADSKTLLDSGTITGSMVRGGTVPGSYSTTLEITEGDTLDWSLEAPTGTRAACSVYIYSPSGETLVAIKTDHTGKVYSLGLTSYGEYTITIVAPGSFSVRDVDQVISFTFTYSIYKVVTPPPPKNTAKTETIPPSTTSSSVPPSSAPPPSSDNGLMVFLMVFGVVVGSICVFVLKSRSGKRFPRWGKALLILAIVACVLLFILSILLFMMKYWWVIALGLIFWFFIWIFAAGIGGRRTRNYDYYREPENTYIIVNGKPQRSDIQRGMDLHVPKVNKKGAEFISGSSSLRKQQKDAMRKTKRKLWG